MRTTIWLVILGIIGVYTVFAFATVDRSSDQAKVDAVITRGVTATEDRNLTGLISCVSADYKDEAGLNYDRLRAVLAQAMSGEGKYAVTTSEQTTQIDGDKATVKLRVMLKRTGGSTFYDQNITLLLAKESGYHMLIAPAKTWRVVGSANLGLDTGGI